MTTEVEARTHGFALHERIDIGAAAAAFARHGRVSIDPFLDSDSAEALREHLLARPDWKLVMNAGDKVYEMPRSAAAALTAEQRETLERKLGESALWGFQYRYESIRVPDEARARTASGTLLDRFAQFLSSSEVLDVMREITGAEIDFADAQATGYGPGHFLTRHDDAVEGKHRAAAYVLGLAPEWRAEWGGLLLFHGPDGQVDHGFVPSFNALRLFRVPVPHSVSCVWPFAPEPRLSVTGWLRRFG